MINIKEKEDEEFFKKKGILKAEDVVNIFFENEDKEKEVKSTNIEITTFDKLINKYIIEQEEKEKKIEEEENGKKEIESIENKINKQADLLERKEEKESEDINKILENIMSGQDSHKKTSTLLKTYRYKIYLNEKYKNEKILKNTEVNSNYFYSEWRNSFRYVKYKREENFKVYVKLENNEVTLKDMEIFVSTLLKNEEFYFFKEEPENYDAIINERIDGY